MTNDKISLSAFFGTITASCSCGWTVGPADSNDVMTKCSEHDAEHRA